MGFEKPIIAIFGFLFVVILLLFALPSLTGVSGVSATDSTNLTSFGSSFSELLPWFGVLVTGGIIAFAVEGKR